MNHKQNRFIRMPMEAWLVANQNLLLVLPCIVFVVVVYLLWIKPERIYLHKLKVLQVNLQKTFEHKQRNAGGDSVLVHQNQLKSLEQHYAKLLQRIPVQDESSGLIAAILKKGASSGVIFEQLSPLEERTEKEFRVQPIQLTVSGSYYQLLLFLKKMHDMNRIVRWHDFNLARHHGEAKDKLLHMTVILKIYRSHA